MTGLTRQARLERLADQISSRDLAIVSDVVRLRYLSAGQIERLHFTAIEQPLTRRRRTNRSLNRLREHGLLVRLERRVGGVKAGSSGFVFGPTGEAKALVALRDGQGLTRPRTLHEPGQTFVDHGLACSEVYVHLREAEQTGKIELLEHHGEPAAWRQYPGSFGGLLSLRPDAFVALGVGEYEHRAFIEVDCGTEGSTALRRKLGTYVEYYRSGREQAEHSVFPQVIWLCSDQRRVAVLQALVAELPGDVQPLFLVGLQTELLYLVRGDGRSA
ncbi:MAG: replication-relaxation family protein [Solirubrobacteraceae bacterium]|nr:replication-relaxation family protein [Solirubrobacteraceae bacterium]